jgi:mannan endo-1,4-beta-mannosidase
MKKLKPYLFFCIIFFLGCEPDSDKDDPTMQVDLTNNVLKDPCGDPVILRGVNRLLVFDSNDPYGVINFPEIKETNANCLRIAWGIKRPNLVPTTPSELDMVLTNCAKNNMIPIISLFDYTSDDDGGFSHLSEYVEYWTNPSIIKIIKKHQGYLIINIANEAGEGIEDEDNPVEMEAKTTIYINAYNNMFAKFKYE